MCNLKRSIFLLASLALPMMASSTAFADDACASTAGNLLANCGFETGDFSGWTDVDKSNYSGVDNHNPQSGSYAANLGAVGSSGKLSQTVTDVVGSYYALTFDLENEIAVDANGNPYPGTNSFSASQVNDLGVTFVLTSAKNIAESSTYSQYEVYFFGTGTDTILFTYLNTPSYFDLDDITLVDPPAPGTSEDDLVADPMDTPSVPEPSSLVLMGTGVMALAGVARRRIQKGVTSGDR
jgi:hypothetical protein